MIKPVYEGDIAGVREAYRENPGRVDCEATRGGECLFEWKGGPIVQVLDEVAPALIWLHNSGGLPWGLEWIAHDELKHCWYIRRKAKR